MASTSKLEEDNQKTLQREIRNMVSLLTYRLTQVHSTKRGSSHRLDDNEEHGLGVITLAGNNTGATMRADPREKLEGHTAFSDDQGKQETPCAYANSNYQSVNNSIMMNGSYSAEDPGIHIDIYDFAEDIDHEKLKKEKKTKKDKKKKKKKHSNSDYSEEDSHDTEGKEYERKEALDKAHEKTSDEEE